MRIRRHVIGCTLMLALLHHSTVPVAHAESDQSPPNYLALIDTLANASTSADSPASPCAGGWHNRQAGPEFLESGCPRFAMPQDYPDNQKSIQLNLMVRNGQVFAVALSHQTKSWEDAAAVATRFRADLPNSFSCEGEPGLLRCASSDRFVVIGSVEDVPGESPAASMLYVRDLASFQAFFANDFPAKAGK